jgi:small subunit ribosomal protein S19
MGRSAWKGPYVAVSLLQDVMALAAAHPEWWQKGRFLGQKAPAVIQTQSRASTILPDFLRCQFSIHNGKEYIGPLEVGEEHVGRRLGEFSATRKVCWLRFGVLWARPGTWNLVKFKSCSWAAISRVNVRRLPWHLPHKNSVKWR